MRNLYNEIMNIPTPEKVENLPTPQRLLYKDGHRDARHAAAELAAELAAEYEDKYLEMVAALRWYGQHAQDARKFGRDGDFARAEIDNDGGRKAAQILNDMGEL